MSTIADNLHTLKKHIEELCVQSGRQSEDVQLIAVSKTRSLEEVQQAVAAGQCVFGENTIQDALTKIPEIKSPGLQWHFIGHLQSNKSGKIPGKFQWIHSVDSLKLAHKLSAVMMAQGESDSLNCLIQINVAEDPSKSGITKEYLQPFLEKLQDLNLPGLRWRGLMTIGVEGDTGKTVKYFTDLKELQFKCQRQTGLKDFDQLSMGMSGDYALAIQQGSTMVRIGTSIFGQRI